MPRSNPGTSVQIRGLMSSPAAADKCSGSERVMRPAYCTVTLTGDDGMPLATTTS